MIDTAFDFRSDPSAGKDLDTWSPTLSRYHKVLWSKPLPSGEVFNLDNDKAPFYLRHRSSLGSFCLSSDTVVPTFKKRAIDGVRFFTPFDDFESPLPVPTTRDAYLDYRMHAIDFLKARNRRIKDWSEVHAGHRQDGAYNP